MSSENADVQHHLASAAEAQRRGDLEAARVALDQVLEVEPDHPAALNSLGMIALSRSEFDQARSLFARAVKADPNAPELRLNQATACRRLGDDEGERAALESALQLNQAHLMANVRLAELHERKGETADALQHWAGVMALLGALPERNEALTGLLDHAQDYVAAKSREMGEIVDAALERARSGVEKSDLRRFDACVDAMLGRRQIYHNQCAGLHFPFLPADEFFERKHFSWMESVEAETETIRAELEALIGDGLPGLSPYVSMEPGTPANKWSGLDKNLDWGAYFLWHHGERKDEACRRCPRTAEILESLPRAEMPRRAPTAFFSLLRRRTRLPAHTGVSNARAIVHLPLIVPPGCGFRVGGEIREWKVGEAFAFDDTIEHEAWNDSDELRAVLIFDVWNPHLTDTEKTMIQAFFRTSDESGFAPGSSAFAD